MSVPEGLRPVPSPVWKDANIDGATIRAARLAAGMTQKKLAEELGVNWRTLGLWERDRSVPQPEARARLVEVLGLSLDPADDE